MQIPSLVTEIWPNVYSIMTAAAPPSWISRNSTILLVPPVTLEWPISICTPNLVQISQEYPKICPFVCFFKIDAAAILNLKMPFWTPCVGLPFSAYVYLCLFAHQIWCKSVKNWRRYALLCIFQNGDHRHLGFIVIPLFWTTHDDPLVGSMFPANGVMIRLNLTKIPFGCKMPILANFLGGWPLKL